MFEEPKTWVMLAFVITVGLLFKPVRRMLLQTLDARSERIRVELEQARKLREEAEATLVQYKQKQAEYLKEAEAMLNKARKDADAISAEAQKELVVLLEARTKMALDKIEHEQRAAVDEVRNHVIDIALAAARATVVDQVQHLPQNELLALALVDLERKIH